MEFLDILTLTEMEYIPENATDVVIENDKENGVQFILYIDEFGNEQFVYNSYDDEGCYSHGFHSDSIWEMSDSYVEWYKNHKISYSINENNELMFNYFDNTKEFQYVVTDCDEDGEIIVAFVSTSERVEDPFADFPMSFGGGWNYHLIETNGVLHSLIMEVITEGINGGADIIFTQY
jgi:hypothetical protein